VLVVHYFDIAVTGASVTDEIGRHFDAFYACHRGAGLSLHGHDPIIFDDHHRFLEMLASYTVDILALTKFVRAKVITPRRRHLFR